MKEANRRADHATREEVHRLREQIQHLRAQPHLLHREASFDTLLDSMERLQAAMDKMVVLFEHANKEIYDEYEQGLHVQSERLQRIEEQNEKIARGVVALADMFKQHRHHYPPAVIPPSSPPPKFEKEEPLFTSSPPQHAPPKAPAVQPAVRKQASSALPLPPRPAPAQVQPLPPPPPPPARQRMEIPDDENIFATSLPLSVPGPVPPPEPPAPPGSQPEPKSSRRSVLEKFSFK